MNTPNLSALTRSLCCALLSTIILNSACFAQLDPLLDETPYHIYQLTIGSFTDGEWTITPVFGDEGIQGLFFSRSVDPISGSYAACYCVRSESDWQTYAYVGPSIGGAALRAEVQFNLQGALWNDLFISSQIDASGYTDTDQPGTQFAEMTNGLIKALYLVGDFQDVTVFPVLFVGTEDSSPLGVFTVASLDPNCPLSETLSPSSTVNMMSMSFDRLVEDLELAMNDDNDEEGTLVIMRPQFGILGWPDCSYTLQINTAWSDPPTCVNAHLISYHIEPNGCCLECTYAETCSQTRTRIIKEYSCCSKIPTTVYSPQTRYLNPNPTRTAPALTNQPVCPQTCDPWAP